MLIFDRLRLKTEISRAFKGVSVPEFEALLA
jgi:hypothetical protein